MRHRKWTWTEIPSTSEGYPPEVGNNVGWKVKRYVAQRNEEGRSLHGWGEVLLYKTKLHLAGVNKIPGKDRRGAISKDPGSTKTRQKALERLGQG